MRRLLLVGLVALTACTPTTTLSGCLVTSTPAGELTPGADAVVIVVPASQSFETGWQRIVTSFREEYEVARTAYGEARARYRTARSAEQSALKAQRQALKTPSARVHDDPVTGARVWSNQTPPSVWQVANTRADAARAMTEAGRRLNGVIDTHLTSAIAAIDTHHRGMTRADARGCYVIAGVPVQKVYVLVNHGDRYWFREVDAARAPAAVDFTPDRTGWPFAGVTRPG